MAEKNSQPKSIRPVGLVATSEEVAARRAEERRLAEEAAQQAAEALAAAEKAARMLFIEVKNGKLHTVKPGSLEDHGSYFLVKREGKDPLFFSNDKVLFVARDGAVCSRDDVQAQVMDKEIRQHDLRKMPKAFKEAGRSDLLDLKPAEGPLEPQGYSLRGSLFGAGFS